MSKHIPPGAVIHPLDMTVTFEVGNHKHVVTLSLKGPSYYHHLYNLFRAALVKEYTAFLQKILVERGTPPPPGGHHPAQRQENIA